MIERFECTDVGRDCSWSTFAATEPQLMQQIAEHAKKEHNIQEISEYFQS